MSLKKGDPALVASRELKRQLKVREEKRFMMRARLVKRDLDYAENAAPVTVEVRGNVVTEWRGPRVIGCHAAAHIHHG